MKRLSFFALFLCLATAMVVAGQTPAATSAARPAAPAASAAAPSAARVAVIEFQAAVAQTNEFQRALADLQKKYDPRKAQLKSLSDEIEALTKQLQDQGAQMSEQDRATKTRSLEDKKKQLDRETQDAQSDFQSDMQQNINAVAQKVGTLMTDYAQKHGYTLVLDASDQQTPTVLYAVQSTDITKAIIDAYNVKSGIPAPPAQGVGSPAVDAPQPQPAAH